MRSPAALPNWRARWQGEEIPSDGKPQRLQTSPNSRVFGIVGWSGQGKTTLLVELIALMTARGLRVSTVKHAHHAFDLDKPGKDSWRHREAGATEVLISSGTRWALLHEHRGAAEPSLDDLLPKLGPVDLVLVEGYKRHAHPKLEVWRAEPGQQPLWREEGDIVAVASNDPLPPDAPYPLPLDDAQAIVDFILDYVGLKP